jgi:RNA polymerase sigma-70 factor (ECF subfamily)
MEAMRAAFIELHDREYRPVVGFVMLNGATLDQAEDATQAAFMEGWALLRRSPEQWAEVRKPRGWLRTVAVRNYRRPAGQRREPPTILNCQLPDRADEGMDPADLTTQTIQVLNALAALPDDVKIVMAFRMHGFSAVESAAHLGISAQQVRDLLKKGRRVLKTRIAETDEHDRRWTR